MNISQPGSIHVLVVDDQEDIRQIVLRTLKKIEIIAFQSTNCSEKIYLYQIFFI